MEEIGGRKDNYISYLKKFSFQYPQVIMLILIFGLFSSLAGSWFLSVQNLINVLRQTSLLYILAIGQTFVILTAGIDLSIGGVLSVSSCICAILLSQKLPISFAMTIALMIGTLFGLANGVIVAKIGIHPFIVTYSMMWISKGAAYVILGGDVLYGFPPSFRFLGAGQILGIPVPIIWAGIIFFMCYVLLVQTRFGRALYGVGANAESARLVGINVSKINVIAYGISGVLASLGGLLYISRLNSAEPAIGELFLLETIAAVIIGGTPFNGGEGGIERTLIGVFVIVLIVNGMNILGIASFWQDLVLGVIIIAGTLINEYVRKRVYRWW